MGAEIPQVVMFDFEGTLVDFQWDLEPAERELRRVLAHSGFEPATMEGDNYAQLWNRAVRAAGGRGEGFVLSAGLEEVYDRYDADALTRWKPRPGAGETLRALRRAGMVCAVVSNVGRTALDSALARFELVQELDRVIGRDDVDLMKPAAEGLTHCLHDLAARADQALFVGDSLSDVRAARAASVPVVIIAGGETGREDFGQELPDAFLEGISSLPSYILGDH